jgi:monofunctional biosynthetic peptidoglycan transglycosylase
VTRRRSRKPSATAPWIRAGLALAGAALLLVGGTYATLPAVSPFATTEPRNTALMEQRADEAKTTGRPFHPRRTPIAIASISSVLVDAVVLSEDASFFVHGPFDFGEVAAAAKVDLKEGRYVRGASTLTQQLAKNLFLGTRKTLWRKFREALLAIKLERTLPKKRILALYLNAVEWGDGVFGAEAGAQSLFKVHAAELTPAQAAVMAAMLPAPRRLNLAAPPRWLGRRSRHVLDLLRVERRIDDAELRAAQEQLEKILEGEKAAVTADAPEEEDED